MKYKIDVVRVRENYITLTDDDGKDISFSVKSRGGEMIEDTTYVTDDDLSVIHMDISEEED